jgi:transcriptional regulator with XRE-family HTH domain
MEEGLCGLMSLLMVVADIMGAIQEAVAALEQGEHSTGVARLEEAMQNLKQEIERWQGHVETPSLPPEEVQADLKAALAELEAARQLLATQ